MTAKATYTANFFYPGTLFPEETQREIEEYDGIPTLADILEVAPDAAPEDSYFCKDRWYAVSLREKIEVLYESTEDPNDRRFVQTSNEVLHSWIVGEKIHVDDIEDQEPGGRNAILASNIRGNTPDGYAVKTRCGNWQLAKDFGTVISDSEARHG